MFQCIYIYTFSQIYGQTHTNAYILTETKNHTYIVILKNKKFAFEFHVTNFMTL